MNKLIGIIWVPRKLLDEMRALAASTFPDETGGVLMGYDAGSGLIVTAMVGPGPDAIHDRQAFVPDHSYQEAQIARVYRESARRHTYLGDWHSHPDGGATLSYRDKRTLRAIANYRPARASSPIMGILTGGDVWSLTVWRCFPRDLRARRFFCRYQEMTLGWR